MKEGCACSLLLPFRGPRSCFADNCTFGDFRVIAVIECLGLSAGGGILDRKDAGPNEGVCFPRIVMSLNATFHAQVHWR